MGSKENLKFADSYHCTSFAHCETCRDLEGGRKWREDISKVFKTDGIDWECPYGSQWGHGQPSGLGELVAKVASKLKIRECGGCRKRRRELNLYWTNFSVLAKRGLQIIMAINRIFKRLV